MPSLEINITGVDEIQTLLDIMKAMLDAFHIQLDLLTDSHTELYKKVTVLEKSIEELRGRVY